MAARYVVWQIQVNVFTKIKNYPLSKRGLNSYKFINEVILTDSISVSDLSNFTYNLPNLVVTHSPPLMQDSVMLLADTSFCHQEIFSFLLEPNAEGQNYLWQDGSTEDSFIADTSGIYWVEIREGNCTFIDTTIITLLDLSINLGNDTVICSGSILNLQPNTNAANFLWQDGSTQSSFLATQAGSYWVEVSQGDCTMRDSIEIGITTLNLNLPNDTTLCENETLLIQPNTNAANFLWQDGSTQSSFLATQAGSYWVEVSQGDCTMRDSIEIGITTLNLNLPNDTIICMGENLVLNIESEKFDEIIWQDGSVDSNFQIVESGDYEVTVNKGNCSKTNGLYIGFENCQECDLYIPNVFSPNDDGINDDFKWFTACELTFFEVTILDRWGNRVYQTQIMDEFWDGKFKGKTLDIGVYLAIFKFKFVGESFIRQSNQSIQILR